MPTPGPERYQEPTSSRCPVLSPCKDFVREPHRSRHTASQHNRVDIYVIEFTIMTLYLLSSGSRSVSRKSIPSVKYLILVRSLWLMSSKRMVYPTYLTKGFNMRCIIIQRKSDHAPLTSPPSTVPTSAATRCATDVAATRLGCVHATTFPLAAQPDSNRYCGSSKDKNG